MSISIHDLKILMRHYIAEMTTPRNDKWRDIPEDKPLKNIIPKGGIGNANPQLIFELIIRWQLLENGNAVRNWPANWPDLTIAALADQLLQPADQGEAA